MELRFIVEREIDMVNNDLLKIRLAHHRADICRGELLASSDNTNALECERERNELS